MKQGDPGYWEWRKKTGKPKAIKTPQKLWDLACEYFQSVDENPGFKKDFIKGGESAGTIVDIETMRPYTWEGLEDFLFQKGIITNLDDYRQNTDGRYQAYSGIIRAIGKVIFNRNFSGAAMNFLNSNLIARQLGLAEKTQVKVTEEQPLFGDGEDD